MLSFGFYFVFFVIFFFFNDTATTEIYTLSYTTLFRSCSRRRRRRRARPAGSVPRACSSRRTSISGPCRSEERRWSARPRHTRSAAPSVQVRPSPPRRRRLRSRSGALGASALDQHVGRLHERRGRHAWFQPDLLDRI